MDQEVVFSSEHVTLLKWQDSYYIQSFKKGMAVEEFNRILSTHPEIRITSFMAIKNSLLSAPASPIKFGEVKERIIVEITSDELKAFITLCVLDNEFSGSQKVNLIREVMRKLNDSGIIFGIKQNVLLTELSNNKQILIAEGATPENGKDSVIRMYEMKEIKPEAKEDGNVDHYELNLINRVKAGEWLGERIDPTLGTPGKSVKGNTILALPGKKYPLSYDKKTVKEAYENGVTTLYSLQAGAVHFEGERVGVSNHLEIQGSIDFRTGNVDFQGYLTVKGTIEDNFSVIADKDIEVLGDYGVGSAKEIISKGGSIFIRGGIAGKNRAVVKSRKDIYTKFVSDATIICEGSVHIGFYCLNSNITAKEVILDSPKGQIIGGNIQAEIKVVSSVYGTANEKRTVVSVKGFNRLALKEKLEKLVWQIEKQKNDVARVKQELAIYSRAEELTQEQSVMYEKLKDFFIELKGQIRDLEDERKRLSNYLRTHGEGEIVVLKKAFPGTLLEIRNLSKEITKPVITTSFYLQDGKIKEL